MLKSLLNTTLTNIHNWVGTNFQRKLTIASDLKGENVGGVPTSEAVKDYVNWMLTGERTGNYATPVNDIEYVDLGGSVLWATKNLGALRIADEGDYYAWGETHPYYADGQRKTGTIGFAGDSPTGWREGFEGGYCQENYIKKFAERQRYRLLGNYAVDDPNIPQGPGIQVVPYDVGTYALVYEWKTGYSTYSSTLFGTSQYLGDAITLKPEDDAATVKLGAPWRMPTGVEFNELINGSFMQHEWVKRMIPLGNTTAYVWGLRFWSTEPTFAGNELFLPVTGCRLGVGRNYNVGDDEPILGYWSNSAAEYDPALSEILTIYPDTHWNTPRATRGDANRYYGYCIRPVLPKSALKQQLVAAQTPADVLVSTLSWNNFISALTDLPAQDFSDYGVNRKLGITANQLIALANGDYKRLRFADGTTIGVASMYGSFLYTDEDYNGIYEETGIDGGILTLGPRGGGSSFDYYKVTVQNGKINTSKIVIQ